MSLFKPEVQYLGYRIDRRGLHPNGCKMEAFKDALAPKAVAELYMQTNAIA